MKRLKHLCIPQIYDIEEDESSFYIVEQYIEGESLKSICQKQKIQEKLIISFAIQICDLIHYLHSRKDPILYLDLKPENILVRNDQLFLVDFGSAHTKADKEKNSFGTPWYAAPEQYLQFGIDERADIYGIGMLLYFMVLGNQYTKEKGKNIDESDACSKELKRIINRCLKFQTFQRYSSVNVLQKKLATIHSKLNKKSNHTITIAIAGASRRIGVTHTALQFASFLNHKRLPCKYLECNNTFALSAIARRQSDSCYTEEGFILYNIPCEIHEEHKDYIFDEKYSYAIFDYGVLTKENLENFRSADHCIVILGAKDWELDAAEACLELCGAFVHIRYMFNFANSVDYQSILRNMEGKACYRIPFEPQLLLENKIFSKNNKGMTYSLFSELLQDMREENNAKKTHVI